MLLPLGAKPKQKKKLGSILSVIEVKALDIGTGHRKFYADEVAGVRCWNTGVWC